MDFIIIANAWSAGRDNPTSKHRIAIELVRQGHRVLWIEGSGMRTPSVGSSSDRLRMVRKVAASLRGARQEEVRIQDSAFSIPSHISHLTSHPSQHPSSLHILSPLFVPLPKYELIRRLNGLICRLNMRFWAWRLGFADPVLINYVPVLAEAMRGWRKRPVIRNSLSVIKEEKRVFEQKVAKNAKGGSAAEDGGGRKCLNNSCMCGVFAAQAFANFASFCSNSLLGLIGRSRQLCHAPNNQEPVTNNSPRAPRVVYHCVDRWDAFTMYDSAMMGEMDQRCCRYADLVIASAGELYERCKAINPHTVLIPHGVDWEHFRRGVSKIPRGDPRKNPAPDRDLDSARAPDIGSAAIGFFGLLSEWVDQELILKLAHEFPRALIVLIGKADVAVTRLQGVSNIQLMGPKPFSELPDYVAGFTVGIIPFVVNDLTRSVNPIKLREMLSAGCPVVSTDLPEVARYQGFNEGTTPGIPPPPPVQVAHTHDEFVAKVRRVLDRPLSPDERRAVSDSMASETWSAKVGEILALLSPSRPE
jgi:glycosyltransferase involved in cell wall biosynthesis